MCWRPAQDYLVVSALKIARSSKRELDDRDREMLLLGRRWEIFIDVDDCRFKHIVFICSWCVLLTKVSDIALENVLVEELFLPVWLSACCFSRRSFCYRLSLVQNSWRLIWAGLLRRWSTDEVQGYLAVHCLVIQLRAETGAASIDDLAAIFVLFGMIFNLRSMTLN